VKLDLDPFYLRLLLLSSKQRKDAGEKILTEITWKRERSVDTSRVMDSGSAETLAERRKNTRVDRRKTRNFLIGRDERDALLNE
jgi:hypothetical protein